MSNLENHLTYSLSAPGRSGFFSPTNVRAEA